MRSADTHASGPSGRLIPLVGRDAELSRAKTALSRAAGGDPGALVFSAPPGMGKSRLSAETLLLASNAGFATYVGHAGEMAMRVAYAPFVEAFGSRLRRMNHEDRLGLLRGLGQLGLVISGLEVNEPRPLGDPALERTRIVDGFAQLIERLTRQTPVALLLEDVHFLDQESAGLLSHLMWTIEDRPLLLVLTTRSGAPDNGQLNRVLTEMPSTAWWQERIAIPPLSEAESAQLLDEVFGGRARVDNVRRIAQRCGGVPRFLESIAIDVRDSGRLAKRDEGSTLERDHVPLPADIRHRIAFRLAALPDDDRRIVELAALSGAHGDLSVLTSDEDLHTATHGALERLEKLLILTTEADGTVTLAQGILQDAVIDEMPSTVKRRRHAELAEALRRRDENDPRIVEHLLRAGSLVEPERAVAALRDAAERARSQGATEDALRYLQAANDAVPASHTSIRAELLVELGLVCVASGHRSDAARHWNQALLLYRQLGDPHGTTRVNRELAQLAWGDGDRAAARDFFDAGEHAQEGLEPTRELAELLYARMMVATRDREASTVVEFAGRLRSLADRLHVPDMSARLLLAEGAQDLIHRDLDSADNKNVRALELATAADDVTLEIRAHDQLSVSASIRGDISSMRRHSEASLDAAIELGAVTMQPWPRIRLTMADMLSGDWDRALRTSADVLVAMEHFGEQRGYLSALGTYAWLLVLRGRLSEAEDVLLPVRDVLAEQSAPAALCSASTALALASGEYDDAARFGAPLKDLAGTWYPFQAAMLVGEAFAHTAPVQAQELVAKIREWEECGSPFPGAVADFVDGLSDMTEGAIEALRSSIDGFDSLGFPFFAARSRLEVAERGTADALHSSKGSKSDAPRLAADALTVFEQLGAAQYAQRARQLLRSLGVVPSRGRPSAETGAPLSKRELEVSRLVASGYSNAQIATELFISPRTVTTHLDHIYVKLELNSRTALTRYLADTGLLTEGTAQAAPHSIT